MHQARQLDHLKKCRVNWIGAEAGNEGQVGSSLVTRTFSSSMLSVELLWKWFLVIGTSLKPISTLMISITYFPACQVSYSAGEYQRLLLAEMVLWLGSTSLEN